MGASKASKNIEPNLSCSCVYAVTSMSLRAKYVYQDNQDRMKWTFYHYTYKHKRDCHLLLAQGIPTKLFVHGKCQLWYAEEGAVGIESVS